MKITFESELMQNNKQAVVMAPDLSFEVLQTSDGCSLFFSIGTDGVFYVTQQVQGAGTGWTRVDLSTSLGTAVTAKTFSVAQNAATGNIDLALAITVNGSDTLYLSQGNVNTSAAFAQGVTWTAIPFDDANNPMPVLGVVDVYVLDTQTSEYFVVDILKQPGSSLNLIYRYYVNPTGTPRWNGNDLSANLAAGSITSCMGQRTNDYVAGIYTFGSILGTDELIFTPLYNAFNPEEPASPARLTLPAGATAIASAPGHAGTSNLFVAVNGSLNVFTPGNQADGASSVMIVTNAIIAGVNSLLAATSSATTAVWGVNQSGELFYVQCAAGSEAIASAWSTPVPILSGVEQIAFYLNAQAGSSVLFAYVQGDELVQLVQDPITTLWQQNDMLLPSTDTDDVIAYNTFTTQITITDDYNLPAGNTAAAITSTSPVSVFINNVYSVLSPSLPLQSTSDATGVLTIVQSTESLTAICFHVQLTTGETADINPMSDLVTTLSTIQSGDDLGKVTVTNADGSQQDLLPTTVSSAQKAATASALQTFVGCASTLPQNGTVQPSGQSLAAARPQGLANSVHKPVPQLWGVSFAPGGNWSYHEGDDAAARFKRSPATALAGPAGSIGSDIELAAGDMFQWLDTAYEDVDTFFVQTAGDVYNFFITIGEDTYFLVMNCIGTVVQAVSFVFDRIGVFFDDLIKWLGFLFVWGDILRTHAVFKNVFYLSTENAIAGMATAITDVKNFFNGLEAKVNNWAGIPDVTTTIGTYQTTASIPPGQNSPQSSWALHHTKSNVAAATTGYDPADPDLSPFTTILGDLTTMISNEQNVFNAAFQQIQTQIIDARTTLTPGELAKTIVTILVDALLSTAENIVITALEVITQLVTGLLDMLDAPYNIPVLSKVYFDQTGDTLSTLDLACLIAAIPATIMYKLIAGVAPFPDDAATTAITSATTFGELQQAFNPPPSDVQGGLTAVAAPVAPSPLKVVTVLLNLVAPFAAAGLVFVGSLKRNVPPGTVPTALNIVGFCIYLPYIGPDLAQGLGTTFSAWYTIMNDCVTGISIIKTFVDCIAPLQRMPAFANYISPGLESAINIIWLAPAFGAILAVQTPAASDYFSFTSNCFFDVGGAITPGTLSANWAYLPPPLPEATAGGFFLASCVCSLMYGAFCGLDGYEALTAPTT